MAEHPTVSRAHITSISDKLKDWWERTLDQKALTPEQTGQLLRDLGFGLNDCLAYIEQQEINRDKTLEECALIADRHIVSTVSVAAYDIGREIRALKSVPNVTVEALADKCADAFIEAQK